MYETNWEIVRNMYQMGNEKNQVIQSKPIYRNILGMTKSASGTIPIHQDCIPCRTVKNLLYYMQ